MDFDLSEDQSLLVSAVEKVLEPFRDIDAKSRVAYHVYADALDETLSENGFFDIAMTDGMGPLEAALVTEQVSRLPFAMEMATTALVAPHLGAELPRPFAILNQPLDRAQRYLPQARTGLFDTGDDLLAICIAPGTVEPVETIYAYPYGRFTSLPDLGKAQSLGADALAAFRQWSRVALAVEMAGAIRAAVDFTVAYTKDRRMFGKQLGTYQSVHHRLAECDLIARSTYWLAMKAAWSRDPLDATLAAGYPQQHVRKLMFDLHQFNGAMGLTSEHLLHFWTFRIRALQAELGGQNEAALAAAELKWGNA